MTIYVYPQYNYNHTTSDPQRDRVFAIYNNATKLVFKRAKKELSHKEFLERVEPIAIVELKKINRHYVRAYANAALYGLLHVCVKVKYGDVDKYSLIGKKFKK